MSYLGQPHSILFKILKKYDDRNNPLNKLFEYNKDFNEDCFLKEIELFIDEATNRRGKTILDDNSIETLKNFQYRNLLQNLCECRYGLNDTISYFKLIRNLKSFTNATEAEIIIRIADYEYNKKLSSFYRFIRSNRLYHDGSYSIKVVAIFTSLKRIINSLIGFYLGGYFPTILADSKAGAMLFRELNIYILGLLAVMLIYYILYALSFNSNYINGSYKTEHNPEHPKRLELIANDYLIKLFPYIILLLLVGAQGFGLSDWLIGFNPHQVIIDGNIDQIIVDNMLNNQ